MSKNKVKSNSNIKCDVTSCDHNNCEEGTCQLEAVEISCNCDNDKCCDTDETICQSFEATKSNITDNEYEVQSEFEESEIYENEKEGN